MLLAALAFVLVPMLREGAAANPENETRRRLRALESARADGVLTDAEYTAKKAALDAQPPASSAADSARSRPTFHFALAVALLLPVAAILLYRELGAPQALDPANLVAAAGGDGASHADVDAAIAQLAEKMKQEPGSVE